MPLLAATKTHYRYHYWYPTVIFLIGVSTIGRSVGTGDVLVRIKECNDIRDLLGVGKSTVPERLKSLSNK